MTAGMEKRKLGSARIEVSANPDRSVLDYFGNAGLEKYAKTRSSDEQLELYRAALIMQLCWYAAYSAL